MSLRGGFLPPAPPVYRGNDPFLRDLAAWAQNLSAELKNYVDVRDQPGGGSTGYTLTNVTTDRVLDADSTTTAELADVVGTLIQDLQTKGDLK